MNNKVAGDVENRFHVCIKEKSVDSTFTFILGTYNTLDDVKRGIKEDDITDPRIYVWDCKEKKEILLKEMVC